MMLVNPVSTLLVGTTLVSLIHSFRAHYRSPRQIKLNLSPCSIMSFPNPLQMSTHNVAHRVYFSQVSKIVH